jgi:hypothetical protein
MADKDSTNDTHENPVGSIATDNPKTVVLGPRVIGAVKAAAPAPKNPLEVPGIDHYHGQGGQYHVDENGVMRKGPKPETKKA